MVQNLFCISFLSGLPELPIFEISGSGSGSYPIPLPLLILILILIVLLILIVILILIPLPLLLQLLLLVLILLEVLAKPALNKKRRKLTDKKSGLGTPFFSTLFRAVRYVLFGSKKERYVLFRSFHKFLATYETQKNVPFFSDLF